MAPEVRPGCECGPRERTPLNCWACTAGVEQTSTRSRVSRTYRPGEVEEIAVAAVVREALWALIAKRDVEELPIEALVDEAAMAAAKVMGRATQTPHEWLIANAPEGLPTPTGRTGRYMDGDPLANAERYLAGVLEGREPHDPMRRGHLADLEVALAELRFARDQAPPQGWRATLGGVVILLDGVRGATSGPSVRLLDESIAALRLLLAEDRG